MNAETKWTEVSLGDCVDLLSGFAFKSKRFTDDLEDIPLVKGANVHQGFIDWDNAKRWPSDEFTEYQRFELREGDVVVAMDRPWIEAGLKWAWIKKGDPQSLLVQRVARLRGNDALLQDYLRYVIGSPAFSNYIRPIVTGVNVPHISGDQIRGFSFRLPPPTTQQKIVAILSSYDDLIENNRRRIKIFEEMGQASYREWFMEFRFPGHETVKMIDSELGEIPEGWEVRRVSGAIDINPRTRVERDVEKWHVPMAGLCTDSMLITDFERRTGTSGAKFRNGDTLFARITPSAENGKTGFVQFLPSSEEVSIGSTEFIVMRSRTLNPLYVYLLARVDEFRQHAIKSMTGASGRQRIQAECFDSYEIAQPDTELLQTFFGIVEPLFRAIHVLWENNNNLRRTRDLLLPKLVSGKIDISELDIKTQDVA